MEENDKRLENTGESAFMIIKKTLKKVCNSFTASKVVDDEIGLSAAISP